MCNLKRLLILIFVVFSLLIVFQRHSLASHPCSKDSDCDRVCEKCVNNLCELKDGNECSAHHECPIPYTFAPRRWCINCQCQCDRDEQCSGYNQETNSYPIVCCSGKCKEKCDE